MKRAGELAVLFGAATLGLSGCGITVARDLGATKPGVVVFDDMCGLQEYYDGLHDSTIATPKEVFGNDIATGADAKAKGGTARYRFDTDFQLHHLRKILSSNWGRLPEEVAKADALELEVKWSEKAGVKRVVTTEDAVLGVDKKNHALPYHVCLSDLLFGEALYSTRRTVLNLPPPTPSPFSKKSKDAVATRSATWPLMSPDSIGASTPAPTPPAAPTTVMVTPPETPAATPAAPTTPPTPVAEDLTSD